LSRIGGQSATIVLNVEMESSVISSRVIQVYPSPDCPVSSESSLSGELYGPAADSILVTYRSWPSARVPCVSRLP
jgi:hypothetical protein